MSGALNADGIVAALSHVNEADRNRRLNSPEVRQRALVEFQRNNQYTGREYITMKDLENKDPLTAESYKRYALGLVYKESKRVEMELNAKKRDWKEALKDWKKKERAKQNGFWRKFWCRLTNCGIPRRLSVDDIKDEAN